ncbi:c-type cytochrome [Pigmentiphaga soli]|uniref:C-type cytochrome n=1 Tax=Pigmentiphaga soli TaxID=1007095 RepID=A0ABP8GVM7_9BURK
MPPIRTLCLSGALLATALALQPAAAQPAPAPSLQPGTMAARLAACTACHGDHGRSAPDGYYPRIAGKPAEYLYNQLVGFRDGRRNYRPMNLLLENMPDEYLRQIAAWFSDQHPPYEAPRPARVSPAELERGRTLVTAGDPARKLPACTACHGSAMTGTLPAIPGLLGVPHDYITAQFGAFASGLRKAIEPDCMADIARRMSPEDISAVAAFLSSQTVQGQGEPAPASAGPLPLACGSQPAGGAR